MLDKLSVPRRPTDLNNSGARAYCGCSRVCGGGGVGVGGGARPTLVAVVAGGRGGLLSVFSLFSFLSPSCCKTAQYRLNYCLKGP